MIAPSEVMQIGRYLLLDRIAAGGMASVHLGRLMGEVGFSRMVAIKRLHPNYARNPEFVAMLSDEARLAARIRHPNVVPTLDVLAESGELFLVMEYVHGESLARLWREALRGGALVPPRIAVAIVCGALYGLHAAHEARSEGGEPLGLVHRDVSPQNILVDVDGVARVLDFGIAKAAWRMQTTQEGQLKGKLSYMSPEQLGGPPLDRRSDLFSLSVVLWELLTGNRYVESHDFAVVMKRLTQDPATPPSAVTPWLPPELDGVVLRGLARDPTERFGTAKEMAVALEEAMSPATAREVGEWVQAVVRDSLEARVALIAEIEVQSRAELSGVAAGGAGSVGGGSPGSRPGGARAAPTASSELPTMLTSAGKGTPVEAQRGTGVGMGGAGAPSGGMPVGALGSLTVVMPLSASEISRVEKPLEGWGAASLVSAAGGSTVVMQGGMAQSARAQQTTEEAAAFERRPPEAASAGRGRWILASIAMGSVVLVGAVLLIMRGLASGESREDVGTSAVTSASTASASGMGVVSSAAVSATSSATSSAAADTASSAAASAAVSATSSAAGSSAPTGAATATSSVSSATAAAGSKVGTARSAQPQTSRPAAPKPSCDPPFFIAKDGTKKYKLECL